MSRRISIWLVLSLIIAGCISLFASSHPDGFEKAGEEVGYIDKATAYLKSPLPDYAFTASDSWLSASSAGLIGVLLTFGFFMVIGRLITRRNQ